MKKWIDMERLQAAGAKVRRSFLSAEEEEGAHPAIVAVLAIAELVFFMREHQLTDEQIRDVIFDAVTINMTAAATGGKNCEPTALKRIIGLQDL